MAKQAAAPAKRRTISPDSQRKRMKDKRRVQLIEANISSVAQHGLAEVTISHVSAAAGMSRGIINFYFDSKETMMRETLAHLLEEQTACWQEALEKTSAAAAPTEKLEALLTALFSNKICTKKKLAVWAAFVAHAATHAPYRYQIEQASVTLRHALAPLLEALLPSPSRAEAATDQMLALVTGLWMGQILGESARERKTMVALCMGLCTAPLASSASIAEAEAAAPQAPAVSKAKPAKAKAKPAQAPSESPVVADLFSALG